MLALAATPPTHDPIPLASWLTRARALELTVLSVDVTVGWPVQLSSPACTVVRGVLGQRLRDLSCSTGARDCTGCAVRHGCEYAAHFDGEVPHPFWLQGIPARSSLEAGTTFEARMVLAGGAATSGAYGEVAFRDALRALLGQVSPVRRRAGRLGELAPGLDGRTELSLRSATPLCLRGDADKAAAVTPHAPWLGLLVRAGLRRLDGLLRAFGGVELPRAALPDLSTVTVRSGAMSPWRGTRYSHRQEQRLPLEGVQGSATLAGEGLVQLAPLLAALAVTNVGKATTMGFGALRVLPARG